MKKIAFNRQRKKIFLLAILISTSGIEQLNGQIIPRQSDTTKSTRDTTNIRTDTVVHSDYAALQAKLKDTLPRLQDSIAHLNDSIASLQSNFARLRDSITLKAVKPVVLPSTVYK